MKRILLILFLVVTPVMVQLKAGVKDNSGEMRSIYNLPKTEQVESHPQKMQFGNFLRGDYLACMFLIGVYIMMKKKKSRKIDL